MQGGLYAMERGMGGGRRAEVKREGAKTSHTVSIYQLKNVNST